MARRRKSEADENEARLNDMARDVQRFRDFAELSSDWFWEQDAELRFTRFFGISPEMLHRDPAGFIGKRRWEMPISGVSPEAMRDHIAACERHEPFRDFVYSIPGEDGGVQHYSISGMPVFDAEGRFTGYHGIGRNVTELRRAELAMADNERHLAQIVDGSPVPIFVIDATHRITHWNQACETLTGMTAGAMIGGRDAWRGFYAEPRPTMADLVVEESAEINIALYYGDSYHRSRLIAGGFEAENFFPQMQGGRWLFFTAAPLYDAHGAICGAIETLQDVTGRKSAERAEREHWQQLQDAHSELQKAMRQLVESEKLASLGRLVAGISHELNTPLGNAMMVATSLQDSLAAFERTAADGRIRRSGLDRLLEDARKALPMVVGSIDRAAALVARFRQITAEQNSERPTVFRLCDLVDGVASAMAAPLREQQVDLTVRIPVPVVLESYPGAIDQILINLVENSLRHGFAGRERGTIRIAAKASETTVVLDYADDGVGMSDEVRRHAFDPFYTTRLGQGGSGLGLYLVHNLATSMLGGSVALLDADGLPGVRFRLTMARQVPGTLAG